MKRYRVSELTGNEILAKPVYLENGQILLDAGTKLKTSYKESLTALEIYEVFVTDSIEGHQKTNLCYPQEKFLQLQTELQEILAQHIYKENSGLKKIDILADKITNLFQKIENPQYIDMRARSSNLYEHIMYTSWLVFVLGKEYGFSETRLKDMMLGCLLHDLGYCYVNINYKNCCREKMTPQEIFELKKHTILAYTALEKENWIPDISRKMILFHHERLDGSGYPLKQKCIEPECRMIQICDAFDSGISGIGCQKKSMEKVFEEISDIDKFDCNMAVVLKKKISE